MSNVSCGFTWPPTYKATRPENRHSFMMQHTARQATFLGLPPELRNSIYKLMLTTCTTEPIHIAVLPANCKSQAHIGIKRTSDHGDPVRGSNILRTSKLIHQEARSILYGDNIFLFMEPQSLRIFASCIGDNKANLRHVQLRIRRTTFQRKSSGVAVAVRPCCGQQGRII